MFSYQQERTSEKTGTKRRTALESSPASDGFHCRGAVSSRYTALPVLPPAPARHDSSHEGSAGDQGQDGGSWWLKVRLHVRGPWVSVQGLGQRAGVKGRTWDPHAQQRWLRAGGLPRGGGRRRMGQNTGREPCL